MAQSGIPSFGASKEESRIEGLQQNVTKHDYCYVNYIRKRRYIIHPENRAPAQLFAAEKTLTSGAEFLTRTARV